MNKAFGELGRELNNFRILRALAGEPEGRVESYDHHLCHAASAFYAVASQAVNLAVTSGRYYSGCLYDVPLVGAVSWMAATILSAREVRSA